MEDPKVARVFPPQKKQIPLSVNAPPIDTESLGVCLSHLEGRLDKREDEAFKQVAENKILWKHIIKLTEQVTSIDKLKEEIAELRAVQSSR